MTVNCGMGVSNKPCSFAIVEGLSNSRDVVGMRVSTHVVYYIGVPRMMCRCDCSQGVSRFLDRAGAADRAAIKAHAQQAQYNEYDDEYDDSYDDLGGPSADGVADVEGNTMSCVPHEFATCYTDSKVYT